MRIGGGFEMRLPSGFAMRIPGGIGANTQPASTGMLVNDCKHAHADLYSASMLGQ